MIDKKKKGELRLKMLLRIYTDLINSCNSPENYRDQFVKFVFFFNQCKSVTSFLISVPFFFSNTKKQ